LGADKVDAALSMNWLHGITNLIHRDLKPANLLVDEALTVKITGTKNGSLLNCSDFGFSQLKENVEFIESNGVARGTPLWMVCHFIFWNLLEQAPEVMMGRKFNEKCDVYSYGIILWQMLTRKDPFEHHTDFRRMYSFVCYLTP
jgi:serine/threonine protein kinase